MNKTYYLVKIEILEQEPDLKMASWLWLYPIEREEEIIERLVFTLGLYPCFNHYYFPSDLTNYTHRGSGFDYQNTLRVRYTPVQDADVEALSHYIPVFNSSVECKKLHLDKEID